MGVTAMGVCETGGRGGMAAVLGNHVKMPRDIESAYGNSNGQQDGERTGHGLSLVTRAWRSRKAFRLVRPRIRQSHAKPPDFHPVPNSSVDTYDPMSYIYDKLSCVAMPALPWSRR